MRIGTRRHTVGSAHDAVRQARIVRFRAILMTKMAALACTLPIAIGYSAGAGAA